MISALQRVAHVCVKNVSLPQVSWARCLASVGCSSNPRPDVSMPPRLPSWPLPTLTWPSPPSPALRLPSLAPAILPLPFPSPSLPLAPPPTSGDVTRREAARLIVIRRRKMRKHKLKKLRKRMRFVWAKVKLRRSIRREKAFQSEQMGMIAVAKQFDARQYVDEVIEKSSTLPMATVRHGKRLPYFIRLQLEGDNILKPLK
ncbi:coiled-coil domain-containing protein 102A-like [Pollicipes pollicipes]|uniref:coiled-coil domain-containing protein 102A-like n=1 Tax=Pollicipes pollicipes TaxID=41117 RepID=UPI00188569AA|nr:coiled-coil domain-containing protein 102A-like [Pollicipes pollicipes]